MNVPERGGQPPEAPLLLSEVFHLCSEESAEELAQALESLSEQKHYVHEIVGVQDAWQKCIAEAVEAVEPSK